MEVIQLCNFTVASKSPFTNKLKLKANNKFGSNSWLFKYRLNDRNFFLQFLKSRKINNFKVDFIYTRVMHIISSFICLNIKKPVVGLKQELLKIWKFLNKNKSYFLLTVRFFKQFIRYVKRILKAKTVLKRLKVNKIWLQTCIGFLFKFYSIRYYSIIWERVLLSHIDKMQFNVFIKSLRFKVKPFVNFLVRYYNLQHIVSRNLKYFAKIVRKYMKGFRPKKWKNRKFKRNWVSLFHRINGWKIKKIKLMYYKRLFFFWFIVLYLKILLILIKIRFNLWLNFLSSTFLNLSPKFLRLYSFYVKPLYFSIKLTFFPFLTSYFTFINRTFSLFFIGGSRIRKVMYTTTLYFNNIYVKPNFTSVQIFPNNNLIKRYLRRLSIKYAKRVFKRIKKNGIEARKLYKKNLLLPVNSKNIKSLNLSNNTQNNKVNPKTTKNTYYHIIKTLKTSLLRTLTRRAPLTYYKILKNFNKLSKLDLKTWSLYKYYTYLAKTQYFRAIFIPSKKRPVRLKFKRRTNRYPIPIFQRII